MPPVHYHVGKFPPQHINWEALIPYIGKASRNISKFDGLLQAMSNAEILLSPLITHEAVLSSKIEGTHVTMGEVLEAEAGSHLFSLNPEKKGDVEEIINYRKALNYCVKEISEKGLTQHLIRQAHFILMSGVRGENKTPGSYRKFQNWVGHPGCTIDNASFVPISPELLLPGLDKWDEYIKSSDELDPLVQLAIAHVEFEALHPFQDGNGRLGRMLIPLFLYEKKILSSPSFYMSGYFDRKRDEYQSRLRQVSSKDDWTSWVLFFLEAVIAQAEENGAKASKILRLYEEVRNNNELAKSPYITQSIDCIFKIPIFTKKQFESKTGISTSSTRRILTSLQNEGYIKLLRPAAGKRSAIYFFPKLLSIVDEDLFI